MSNRANGRRKTYFEVRRTQKENNRKSIQKKLRIATKFCEKIGLKIDNVILSPVGKRKKLKPKLTIFHKNITKRDKVFKWMCVKDKLNVSDKKYQICRLSSKEINPILMPNLHLIKQMQKNLNHFFKIVKCYYNPNIHKPIEKGCYVDPLHKISYVCSKFLNQNENYNENTIRIRLSADSTQISKQHDMTHLNTFSSLMVLL